MPSSLAPNRLTHAVRKRAAAGEPIIDLTTSNPTQVGFDYPADLLAPLADARGLTYEPHPFGMLDARRAVAADYARHHLRVDPERVVLTASTSEAYSLVFKLLADAGDDILVPRPSYPLFDHLTRLDGLHVRPYALEYHGAWSIDFDSVERAWTPRTRAVLVVTPNNPTGSIVTRDELERLARVCASRDVAIVADEVFADYELESGASARGGRFVPRDDVLSFSLGGLSKTVGLPQVKLGWIVIGGPDSSVQQALERLELICDTYLSVSTPVQGAAAELLRRGGDVRAQISRRITDNYRQLRSLTAVSSCACLRSDAGWYAVLQVPSLEPEEDLVVRLLQTFGVVTHPGYFFDFARESFLVVSLLPQPNEFAGGVTRVLRHFDCTMGAS